jgi:hypothetical protein
MSGFKMETVVLISIWIARKMRVFVNHHFESKAIGLALNFITRL